MAQPRGTEYRGIGLGRDVEDDIAGLAVEIPSTSREDFYGVPVCLPPIGIHERFGTLLPPFMQRSMSM